MSLNVINISTFYLITLQSVTDCLVNMAALVIINEFDNIAGNLFRIFLDTQGEIPEDFLQFQKIKIDMEISYNYCQISVIIQLVFGNFSFWFYKLYLCSNFDEFYE